MEFLIRSYGGDVGFEAEDSVFGEDDPHITHHIVDRPLDELNPKREYVQPQWVLDSINNRLLLPVYQYAPGHTLPAHLSPFVDN